MEENDYLLKVVGVLCICAFFTLMFVATIDLSNFPLLDAYVIGIIHGAVIILLIQLIYDWWNELEDERTNK